MFKDLEDEKGAQFVVEHLKTYLAFLIASSIFLRISASVGVFVVTRTVTPPFRTVLVLTTGI